MKKLILVLTCAGGCMFGQTPADAPAVAKPVQGVSADDIVHTITLQQANANYVADQLGRIFPVTSGVIISSSNNNTRSFVVRGPTAVVKLIEDTAKSLDLPPSTQEIATVANVEVTVQLLYASSKGDPNAKVPPALDATVKQLKGTFSYASYRVMDVMLLRGRDGRSTEESGTLSGTNTIYQFKFTTGVGPKTTPRSVRLRDLNLGLRWPMVSTSMDQNNRPQTSTQYISTGINTDLDVREGQTTVVGKSSIAGTEDAIFMVVTVKVIE